MHASLIAALQSEERQLVTELRATVAFRRLDAIRRLIALYGGAEGAPAGSAAAAGAGAAGLPPSTTSAGDVPALDEDHDGPGPRAVREGNKAVSVVRAALAAVTN
jgi:hypothetical protein